MSSKFAYGLASPYRQALVLLLCLGFSSCSIDILGVNSHTDLSGIPNSGFYGSTVPEVVFDPNSPLTLWGQFDGKAPNPEQQVGILLRSGSKSVLDLQSSAQISSIPTSLLPPEKNKVSDFYGGNWQHPIGPIERIQIARFSLYQDNHRVGGELFRTYFVGKKWLHRFHLPVLSLIVEPDDFFDFDKGIYVPGRSYLDKAPISAFAGTYGNYAQSGRAWERPAYLEFFLADGRLAFNLPLGVRIGGQARAQPNHTLDFFARSEYGRSEINYDLWKDGRPITKSFKLRTGGSLWNRTFVTDEIFQIFSSYFDIDMQREQPVVLFLNGEYWGIHNFRDIYDENYLAVKYGFTDTEKSNLDFFSNTEYDLGNGTHYSALLKTLWSATVADDQLLDDSELASVDLLMDVDNFITYSALIYAFGNQINPNDHNDKRWRFRGPQGAGPRDGRWRWMVIDGDFALYDQYGDRRNLDKLFTNVVGPASYLVRSQLFRQKFINKVSEIYNSVLRPGFSSNLIDTLVSPVAEEMPYHLARWGEPASFSHDIALVKNNALLLGTTDLLQNQMIDYFNDTWQMGITGTASLVIDVIPQGSGTAVVNQLHIQLGTPGVTPSIFPWKGTYLKNIPIPISVKANPGFHFVRWQDNGSSNSLRTETLTKDKQLVAVFESGN